LCNLCESLREFIYLYKIIYCMIMAGFFENFLAALKRSFPFLNNDNITPDVVIGVVMHIILVIIILVLVLRLLQQLQALFH